LRCQPCQDQSICKYLCPASSKRASVGTAEPARAAIRRGIPWHRGNTCGSRRSSTSRFAPGAARVPPGRCSARYKPAMGNAGSLRADRHGRAQGRHSAGRYIQEPGNIAGHIPGSRKKSPSGLSDRGHACERGDRRSPIDLPTQRTGSEPGLRVFSSVYSRSSNHLAGQGFRLANPPGQSGNQLFQLVKRTRQARTGMAPGGMHASISEPGFW
jgi:hypothetical protein